MDEIRLIDANNLKFILKLGLEQGTIKTVHDVEDFIDEMTVFDKETLYPRWRNPDADPPKVETEVLILYCYWAGYGITTAFYEDGTILQNESAYYFEDIEDWGTYDEEKDEYRIPKGWWEQRHYCPDDVPDYQVDDTVVGWMPLPNPPKKSIEKLYWCDSGACQVCPVCGYRCDDPYYIEKYCTGCGTRLYSHWEEEENHDKSL